MASVALLTVTGILSQAVGFAYRVGLTRLAGAEIMGLYQLILPVYSILLSLTSVGLTTGVSNLSAWYQALGDRRRSPAVCCCSFPTPSPSIFWGTPGRAWG